ncbi:MAG TPA: AbrB/MazE/SpoVT family DNA-binding domain-containing protein [Aquabacterium sp.]|nr:AbrB/MazE/SpoVT family DNA-binding domain-containing protein [Aquabacterium sp.]
MTTATLTSKGQITIPADVRRSLGVQTGDRVEFVEIQPGRFELVAATRSVRELKGMFGRSALSLSVEDMNRVIAEQGAKAGLRSGRSK